MARQHKHSARNIRQTSYTTNTWHLWQFQIFKIIRLNLKFYFENRQLLQLTHFENITQPNVREKLAAFISFPAGICFALFNIRFSIIFIWFDRISTSRFSILNSFEISSTVTCLWIFFQWIFNVSKLAQVSRIKQQHRMMQIHSFSHLFRTKASENVSSCHWLIHRYAQMFVCTPCSLSICWRWELMQRTSK